MDLSLDIPANVDNDSYRNVASREQSPMRTVQMTLEDELVQEVDRVAISLGTTRSGFTRDALRAALNHMRERDLERRQREGYERQPVQPGEFDAWEGEQVWGD
jgi:predicted transcriptional regulator